MIAVANIILKTMAHLKTCEAGEARRRTSSGAYIFYLLRYLHLTQKGDDIPWKILNF